MASRPTTQKITIRATGSRYQTLSWHVRYRATCPQWVWHRENAEVPRQCTNTKTEIASSASSCNMSRLLQSISLGRASHWASRFATEQASQHVQPVAASLSCWFWERTCSAWLNVAVTVWVYPLSHALQTFSAIRTSWEAQIDSGKSYLTNCIR